MAKNTEKQIIKDFLDYYFQTRKFQYSKEEIKQNKVLIEIGVLYEIENNADVLEISSYSKILQETVLEISETKLNKKLPLDISSAFKFIDDFNNYLKKKYDCERVINVFDTIIKGLKPYVLSILHEQGINVTDFLFSLENKRKKHLLNFERSLIKFLFQSTYSEKETFEILGKLWVNDIKKHDIVTRLRALPSKNLEKGKQLLEYAYHNNVSLHFVSELLIGIYNVGETSSLEKIIELKNKDVITCLGILGRIKYKSEQDVEKAFSQIGNLEFENKEIAIQQSYLIQNIIKNEYTTNNIRDDAFKLYVDFLKDSTDEIKHLVFQDIYFLDENEAMKYGLLHLYLSKTKNFSVIRNFFHSFKDPAYIFDITMRLFNTTPNYRFSMDLFEDDIGYAWNTNQLETEKHILNLFKQHPAFGILGVKVIFSAYRGIFSVDLLKLENAEYQINAINNICKYPHSFDKLLPLILPLRNSKYKGGREYLQNQLAKKVFSSYHGAIYNQIESSISKNKKDKEFLKPIKKALDAYHKLNELKESLDDLNPYENERELMDLYYRLEHEENAKRLSEINQEKGTFMEMVRTNIIVRGNSFKFEDRPPMPLNKIESSMLIDGSSYLNPDLYEHNLNIVE